MFLILTLIIPKPFPIMDVFRENTISICKGWGFRAGENGFSMRVLVYGFEVGFFLCGSWCGSLVVPSCGSWVGSFGGLRVEA